MSDGRPSPGQFTAALHQWQADGPPPGGPAWLEIYAQLKRLVGSARRLDDRSCELATTALAHETMLRLSPRASLRWRNREHFFRVAARTVRRLLIDLARQRKAIKRGGGQAPGVLTAGVPAPALDADQVLDLDQALRQLAVHDRRCARVVELRYFGGLGDAEVAAVLGVSKRTVEEDWRYARTWLKRELGRAHQ